jgi:hypothetical protein
MHLLDFHDTYLQKARETANLLGISRFVSFYCGDAMLLTEEWVKAMEFKIISTTAAI